MKRATFFLRAITAIVILLSLCIQVCAQPQTDTPPAAVEQEPIVSAYYQIDRAKAVIMGIAPGTTVQQLCNVCLPSGVTLDSQTVATGSKLMLEGAEASTLTVVVTGDLSGDGKVTVTDMLMLRSALLGQPLDVYAQCASDVNYDGKVTVADLLCIKSAVLGMEKISAGRTAGSDQPYPLELFVCGESRQWASGVAAVQYAVSDETVATISADGVITAGAAEGSAYVYALDDQGDELTRAVVTVLKDGLQVCVAQSENRVQTGMSLSLKAQLNHPVSADVKWSSSNTGTVTVSQSGIITGLKAGTATVTAQLDNGSKTQMTITVAPPITGLEIERTLYKVKPGNSRSLDLLVKPAGQTDEFIWTSSDPSVATVNNQGVVTGVKNGTVTITVKAKYSGLSASCKVKICNVKQVALTFDDGPSGHTTKLLDYLNENDIRVTFFLVGNRMNSFASTVKRQAAEGHEMGYHSYAHATQTGLSDYQIRSDFDKSNNNLKSMTGREFTVWRTPGGAYNDRVLKAVPVPHIFWSVDTLDWRHRSSGSTYASIVNNSKDGSIVLMHDLYSSTVSGAISAMDVMQKGDYEFVTVTELLSRDGTPPTPSTNYIHG